MASQDTIKEFLVGLGFKVDQSSLNKFTGGVGTATNAALKLGIAVAGAVTAAELFTSRISAGLDKIYFSSKRTGASANEINNFSFAMSQLGSTTEEAQTALEGIARFQRTHLDRGAGILQAFGVSPAHLNDAKKILDDLALHFQQLKAQGQEAIAIQQGGLLGLPENVVLALENPKYFEELNKNADLMKEMGVNQEELLDNNRKYAESISKTEKAWGQVANIIVGHLLPGMSDLAQWSIEFAKNLPPTLDKIGDLIVEMPNEGILKTLSDNNPHFFNDFINENFATEEDYKQRDIYKRGSGKSTPASTSDIRSAIDFFRSKGWSSEQAAGIVSNLVAESGLNTSAIGDKASRDGPAIGIAQWHKDRQAIFERLNGHSIYGAPLAEQLEFVNYELTKGARSLAGSHLAKALTARQAAGIVSHEFETPANGDYQAMVRGNYANQLSSNVTQTNNITVNAPNGNAQEIAKSVSNAMSTPSGFINYRLSQNKTL
jgi:hypothetical protein